MGMCGDWRSSGRSEVQIWRISVPVGFWGEVCLYFVIVCGLNRVRLNRVEWWVCVHVE